MKRLENQQQARAQSKQGQQLMRSCRDWTEANQQLGTRVTMLEARKACKAYDEYVDTGRL